MAKKPTPTPSDEDVIAEVLDALNFNGEGYAPGDPVSLPLGEAKKLRALGVVAFDDPKPAA